jgi:hypothetical protein
MDGVYEAVSVTTDGIFRAKVTDPQTIAISEDGVDGVADIIHLHPNEVSAAEPGNLAITLKWWVLENVRGIDVIDTYLETR